MRDIALAASRLLLADNDELEVLVKHDPDIIREVATAFISKADGVRDLIVKDGRISYPSRIAVKNLADAVVNYLAKPLSEHQGNG